MTKTNNIIKLKIGEWVLFSIYLTKRVKTSILVQDAFYQEEHLEGRFLYKENKPTSIV